MVVVVAVTELSVVVISPVVDDSVTPDNTVITSRSIAQSLYLMKCWLAQLCLTQSRHPGH